MAVEQKLEIDGEVTEALPNLMFRVKLENDHELLAHLALDSRAPVVYNRRVAPGGGQAAGGGPLRHAASVSGVGMEDIP